MASLENITYQEIGKQLRQYNRKGFNWRKEGDRYQVSAPNSNIFFNDTDIAKKLEETKLISGDESQLQLINSRYICELLKHKQCPINCYYSSKLKTKFHYR